MISVIVNYMIENIFPSNLYPNMTEVYKKYLQCMFPWAELWVNTDNNFKQNRNIIVPSLVDVDYSKLVPIFADVSHYYVSQELFSTPVGTFHVQRICGSNSFKGG